MSQALRKLTSTISKSNTCVIFINQTPHEDRHFHGKPGNYDGGNALKFYASVRMDIRRVGAIKDGQDVIGNRTRVKVVKNKMALPSKRVESTSCTGKDFPGKRTSSTWPWKKEIIQKSGAWFSFDDERIGQGRENSKAFLKEHPEVATAIEGKIKDLFGLVKKPKED